jgi:hypothetical protein
MHLINSYYYYTYINVKVDKNLFILKSIIFDVIIKAFT